MLVSNHPIHDQPLFKSLTVAVKTLVAEYSIAGLQHKFIAPKTYHLQNLIENKEVWF